MMASEVRILPLHGSLFVPLGLIDHCRRPVRQAVLSPLCMQWTKEKNWPEINKFSALETELPVPNSKKEKALLITVINVDWKSNGLHVDPWPVFNHGGSYWWRRCSSQPIGSCCELRGSGERWSRSIPVCVGAVAWNSVWHVTTILFITKAKKQISQLYCSAPGITLSCRIKPDIWISPVVSIRHWNQGRIWRYTRITIRTATLWIHVPSLFHFRYRKSGIGETSCPCGIRHATLPRVLETRWRSLQVGTKTWRQQ